MRTRLGACVAALLLGGWFALVFAPPSGAQKQPDGKTLPRDKTVGQLEVVATFDGPMPTGVTVSHKGRVFVCFPRWEDKGAYTVAEVKGGKATPYPDAAMNRPDEGKSS